MRTIATRLLAAFAALLMGTSLLATSSAQAEEPEYGSVYGSHPERWISYRPVLYPPKYDKPVTGLRLKVEVGRHGYSMGKVPPGRYRLCWPRTSSVPYVLMCHGAVGAVEGLDDAKVFEVRAGKATRTGTATFVRAGFVAGSVVDAKGVPVPGALVCGRPQGSTDSERPDDCSPEAVTDAHGRYTATQLGTPSPTLLSVTTTDGLYDTTYLGSTTRASKATVLGFERESGRHVVPVRMQARDVPTYSGQAVGEGGNPLRGAVVTARRLDAEGEHTAAGGLDGRFRLGLDPGTWEISVAATGYDASVSEVVVSDDVDETYTLLKNLGDHGAVRARVTAGGKPIGQVPVEIRQGVDGPVVHRGLTDEDGVFVKRDLAPGSYRAFALRESGAPAEFALKRDSGTLSFTVRAGSTIHDLHADLTFAPYVQLVVPPQLTRQPVEGSWVSVTRGTWKPADVDVTYQWLVGNRPVPGATGPSYKPTADDVGKGVKVYVTAARAPYSASWRALSDKLYVQPKGSVGD